MKPERDVNLAIYSEREYLWAFLNKPVNKKCFNVMCLDYSPDYKFNCGFSYTTSKTGCIAYIGKNKEMF